MNTPRLRARLLAIAVIAMLLTSATVIGTSVYFLSNRMVQTELTWARSVAAGLRVQLDRLQALGLQIDRLQGFEEQCAMAVIGNEGLAEAYVVAPDGQILFHSDPERMRASVAGTPIWQQMSGGIAKGFDADAGLYFASESVTGADDDMVAQIVVTFPEYLIEHRRNALIYPAMLASLFAIALGAAVLWLGFARYVARPVGALLESIEGLRASSHAPGQRLPQREFDELEQVVDGFNRLLDRIEIHERELKQAKDAAVAANASKSAFLANMSHELRTPLNAILGFTGIILRRDPGYRYADHLRKTQQAADQLLAIINDVLDFARIEAHKLTIEPRAFRVIDMVDAQVALVAGQAREKGLTMSVEVAPELHHPCFIGDPLRISQILLNLLSNAVKFTEHGGIQVRVDRRLADDVPMLRFRVTDTGIGMRPEQRARLFLPFEQADNSSTRKYHGAGLGLSISARLVSLMHGRIGCESEAGVGTTLWFALPAEAETEPAQVAAVRCDPPPPMAPATTQEPAIGQRARVLLVEDDVINQMVAQEFLSELPVDVVVADNGEQAVQLASASPFTLILMDLQLPGVDGIEATWRIRRNPGAAHIPIIAMTANAFAEDRERCLAAGMDDFIAKPIDPALFSHKMAQWLNRTPAASGTAAPGGPIAEAATS